MIAPASFSAPPALVPPDLTQRVSRILDAARFHSIAPSGSQLWELRKPIGCWPRGAILTRQTLERLLFES